MLKKTLSLSALVLVILSFTSVSVKAQKLTARQQLLMQLPDGYSLDKTDDDGSSIEWEVWRNSPWGGPAESIVIRNSGYILIVSSIGLELKSLTAFADLGSMSLPILSGAFDNSGLLIPDKAFENEFSEEDVARISRGIAKKTKNALAALGIETDSGLKERIDNLLKTFPGNKTAI